MKILLTGATGMIGGSAAKLLASETLHILARRALDSAAPQTVEPTENWPTAIAAIRPDIVICALGTTIRQAGSQEAFRAVDHDLVVSVAGAANAAGARHIILVSSVGASAASNSFYLKTKGDAERAVRALGFDRLDILRPGLLRGNRQGPRRLGEAVAKFVSPLTDLLTPPAFSHFRSIAAGDVAKAIKVLTHSSCSGVHVHHNREMLALAHSIR
jgi:uncharacterized protein YbjT (DUF2867 family)